MADLPHINRKNSPNGDSTPIATPLQDPIADDVAPLPEPEPDDDDEVPAATGPSRGRSRWMWQGKVPEAFWKAAPLFSFGVNLILVLALPALGLLVFHIKMA